MNEHINGKIAHAPQLVGLEIEAQKSEAPRRHNKKHVHLGEDAKGRMARYVLRAGIDPRDAASRFGVSVSTIRRCLREERERRVAAAAHARKAKARAENPPTVKNTAAPGKLVAYLRSLEARIAALEAASETVRGFEEILEGL